MTLTTFTTSRCARCLSIFNQTIASTSLVVCQRLCNDTRFYDSTCSGLFWFRHNQSCKLTSYTGHGEINNCSATNALDHVMYFKRIRYVHTRPIYCTFDDDIDIGACPLIESDNYIYKWDKSTAKSIAGHHGDVTTGLGGGKVLWLNTTGALGNYGTVGEITTPLLNTTGKCLMLFHFVSRDELHFLLHVVEENHRVVLSKDLTSHIATDEHRYTWWPYFFTLPSGLHWIKLTAQGDRPSYYMYTRFNFIDDLSIRPCEDYKRECLLSSQGLEYMDKLVKCIMTHNAQSGATSKLIKMTTILMLPVVSCSC
jgi:hypothetical protein